MLRASLLLEISVFKEVLLNIKKDESKKNTVPFFTDVCHLFLNNSVPKEKA